VREVVQSLSVFSNSFGLCRFRKLPWCIGFKDWSYCCAWPVLRYCSCYWKNRRICWNLGYVSYGFRATGELSVLSVHPAFPAMITNFGGSSSPKGNTGPFWVGSSFAILSATIVYFFVIPLDHDGMKEEDAKVRDCLSRFPRCLHALQHSSGNILKRTVSMSHSWVFPKLKPCHMRKGRSRI